MENKIRIYHSLWSLPMRLGRWNISEQLKKSLIITALSLEYAKQNGAYVVCHCDSFFKEYIKHFGYDDVICDLDIIEKEIGTDPLFMWAAGKFYALQNEPIGSIHIDFDVFLTKHKVMQMISNDSYDILFSHIESSENYEERKLLKDYIPTCDMSLEYAANVGILKFNNQEAKDEYIDHYLKYFKTLKFDTHGDRNLNADLILEQTYLLQMCNKYSYSTLIGDLQTNSIFQLQEKSVDIGFEHLLGREKYFDFLMSRTKKKLNEFNPKLYDKILNFDV